MRLIAKAALGTLALASVATVTPAGAQPSVVISPNGVTVEPRDPCLRAPEFRPGYCFRNEYRPGYYWDRFSQEWRPNYAYNDEWRERMRERREAQERRERLEHQYGYDYDMH